MDQNTTSLTLYLFALTVACLPWQTTSTCLVVSMLCLIVCYTNDVAALAVCCGPDAHDLRHLQLIWKHCFMALNVGEDDHVIKLHRMKSFLCIFCANKYPWTCSFHMSVVSYSYSRKTAQSRKRQKRERWLTGWSDRCLSSAMWLFVTLICRRFW